MKFIYWLLLFVTFLVLVTAVIILITIFTNVEEENLRESQELFELSIIHFSDFHARFDEISEKTFLPCAFNNTEEPCIGGIARMKTMIDSLISKRRNAIVLNAGDNFQGTFWYNLLRHNVTSYFLNLLPIDANVLGNHEFAHGIEGLKPFLKALNSPIVLANLDHRHQLDFDSMGIIKKSIIIERSARKIGVIGVMLREVSEIAIVDKLKFTNEIDAIRNESTRLRQLGVNIIIVLSHPGLDRDKIIAEECGDYVDVIVGGHSHSFLYTPSASAVNVHDVPVGSYPLVLTPKSGRERKVLVVHASAFTKYVGDLRVYFNAAGYVKYYDGNPIYLSNEIAKDPEIDAKIVPWRNEVLRLAERVVGNTTVDLIHTECRHGECKLGNFVADALVSANHGFKNIFSAIIHAAGLRNSIHSGDIHYGDIIAALPFENTLDVLEMRGDMLHEVFEHSVSRSFVVDEFIGIHMLQIAGFRVTFNTSHSVGERVQSLEIKINEKCEYEKVSRNNKQYRVIVPSFLSNGGDGFTMMIQSKRKNQQKGLMLDIDAIESYIALKSPITEEMVADAQQRIVMLT